MDLLDSKKQDNIAGYVISMWHIQDLMPACRFDIDAVERMLVAPIDADEESKAEVRDWYAGIMQRMLEQDLEQTGHLSEVQEVIDELEALHHTLVQNMPDDDYSMLYEKAAPGLEVLNKQEDGEEAPGPIHTGLTAVYGVMVLRAKEQPISDATLEAEGHIRRMLEELSSHYRHMRKLPGVSLN